MTTSNIPADWCPMAQQYWLENKKGQCIQQVITTMNQHGVIKPKGLYEQAAYYLYLMEDYKSAAFFIEQGLSNYPNEAQMTANLVSIYSSLKRHSEAINLAKQQLNIQPDNTNILDALCSSLYQLNDFEQAAHYGTQSLIIKDKHYSDSSGSKISLNGTFTDPSKKDAVLSYSLWGNHPRYINGLLRNLILAKDIYPDWQVWIYLDDSVDEQHINAFIALGGIIKKQPFNQSVKQKLCWRFLVANDPNVGYFMVRDADAVITSREYHAVQDWLTSDKPFHILRDWWSHTDLILAGMWGGIAGVLPDMTPLIEEFQSGKMVTPHIDQWFLGQILWPVIKEHSLIHDRCFTHPLSIPPPGIDPGDIRHIGSCEHTQDSIKQEEYLAPWKHMLYKNQPH